MKVEIGQYRQINKGSLKAKFTLVIYPIGLRVSNCAYFCKDGDKWFSFPTQEVKHEDGRKTNYYPFVKFLDAKYTEELKEAVLLALTDEESVVEDEAEELFGREENKVSGEKPFVWE